LEPNVKLSSISPRGLLVLALALVAACGDDGTGIDTSVGGEYTLVASVVSSLDNGQTTRRTAPVVLYEGPATASSGAVFDIRFELISSRMTLVESGSTYQFSGTYRLTETRGRFPAETETFTASGTYSRDGSRLTLAPSASSEVDLNSDAMLFNGKLSVDVTDPFFGIESLYEFRK
jgi:hypothetical protein